MVLPTFISPFFYDSAIRPTHTGKAFDGKQHLLCCLKFVLNKAGHNYCHEVYKQGIAESTLAHFLAHVILLPPPILQFYYRMTKGTPLPLS